jgi:hypothetical protein
MSQVAQRQTTSRIGALQIAIIVLVAVTACIHLSRALAMGAPSMKLFPLIFYLNFIGYAVLVIAHYAPQLQRYQRATRWILVAYAAITIIAWVVITQTHSNILGYIDKPVEIALIVLLVIEDQRSRQLERG